MCYSCTVHQDSDEEIVAELFHQDSSHSNPEMITSGMTLDISVGQALGLQVDRGQPGPAMVTEGSRDSKPSQGQSAGRFELESNHLALKNNSEYVYVFILKTINSELGKFAI